MRGLTLIVATADPARFQAALSFAAAQAALGGRARVHLHGESVALLGEGAAELAALRAEAAALGVTFTICQTGLATLPDIVIGDGVEAVGPLGLIAGLEQDRLIVF